MALKSSIVTPLSDLDVLIVDCQTTGATPELGTVLEIGWAVTRAMSGAPCEPEAHWVALPEGHRVPFQVRRLTGFDENDGVSTLAPEAAWQRLREATAFADHVPTAIHFAKFELAFLRDWGMRFEPARSFPFDAVCIHAAAVRLYPDLPRRSLRALAGYLGHGVDAARRCSEHVEATAFVWAKIVSELATRGVGTWEELGAWLIAPHDARRPKKRRYPLPPARYRELPGEPGVYHLLRSNGDLLYVGKAANLRKRVASHFTSGFSRTERALEMLSQVHDLRVTPTPTALEAALLENETIKKLCPPYNVQLLVDDPRIWFVGSDLEAVSSTPDQEHRWGPLPSTFSVRAIGALTSLLTGAIPSPVLRARAVTVPLRWSPDEAVFASGFSLFAERHDLCASDHPKVVRRKLTALARKLLLTSKDAATKDGEAAVDENLDGANGGGAWDAERVARHLERAIAHGYQLLQRARWLCLLHDSVVVFQEPDESARWLEVRAGIVVDSHAIDGAPPFPSPSLFHSVGERKAGFDRERYDRLRTLTSELKRILRDGGRVEIRVSRSRWLRAPALRALFLWV